MTALAGWDNFFVIVGSSAGALIGLQFVVVALIADVARRPSSGQASAAFATPNIVHFGTVLLLCAALTAPWRTIIPAAVVWGFVGVGGLIYAAIVIRRMRLQTAYRPVFEDWAFHAVLPIVAYTTLAASALAALTYAYWAMFCVAAATLALLFTGIHNAWDAATYHVFLQRHVKDKAPRPTE
jgi:hypothetical protein